MLDKNEHLRMSKVNEAIEEFPVPFIKIIRDPLINPLNLTERTTQSNHSTTELLTTPPTGRLHRHQPCTSPALVAISLRASSSCSGLTCARKKQSPQRTSLHPEFGLEEEQFLHQTVPSWSRASQTNKAFSPNPRIFPPFHTSTPNTGLQPQNRRFRRSFRSGVFRNRGAKERGT